MREPEGTKLAVSSGAFTTIPRGGTHCPVNDSAIYRIDLPWLKFKNLHAPAVRRLEEEDGDDRWEALASVPRLPDDTTTNHPLL